MQEIIFSPSDFVAVLNQTLEVAYPAVVIEGELANFRVSKNRWVYFDLQDRLASVSFFGTVYNLPGPLQDGLTVKVVGTPRMHPRFGFSVSFQSIAPTGEGSLKKAADLLLKKLSAEGLFAPERKRPLPRFVRSIGLITSANSAAATDFIKILNERWSGVEVFLADVYVQGEQAPLQLVEAIKRLNGLSRVPEVLVITRGGGSVEDLAAFSDERVVRAVAASRIPTVVAIGHEVDVSLAELAADQRASTPSNAVQLVTPDKKHQLASLQSTRTNIAQMLIMLSRSKKQDLQNQRSALAKDVQDLLAKQMLNLQNSCRLLKLFDPNAALSRGYAIVSLRGKFIKKVRQVELNDRLDVELSNGKIKAKVQEIMPNG